MEGGYVYIQVLAVFLGLLSSSSPNGSSEPENTPFGSDTLCNYGDQKSSPCVSPDFQKKVQTQFHPEWQTQNLSLGRCLIYYFDTQKEMVLFPSAPTPPKTGNHNPTYDTSCLFKGTRIDPKTKQRVTFTVHFFNDLNNGIYAYVNRPGGPNLVPA